MKKFRFLYFLLVFALCNFFAESAPINNTNVVIGNNCIKRNVSIKNSNVSSDYLVMHDGDKSFIRKGNEFSFSINDEIYTGLSDWNILNVNQETSVNGIQYTTIKLGKKTAPQSFELTLNYTVYPGLPLVRKWLSFENVGTEDIKIESVNVEDLQGTIFSVHSVLHNNYGRMKHLMKYEGDWDDAVAVLHDIDNKRGVALGNEAPSVLKRTAFHTIENNIEIGLTKNDSEYPFRKWLKPNQKWETPKTFICLYENEEDGFQVINNDVNKFVTNNMGNKITQLKHKPTFVYNTWYPFKSFINDSLVRTVAKAASECGIQEFVIDDGWQCNIDRKSAKKGSGQNYGDWLVDLNKFPQGLKPTFDYIKSLGMKPGLWISLASANETSQVFKEHPEWFVQDVNGNFTNLHTKKDNGMYTASFGTGWVNYIKNVILRLVKEYGLEYAKLDLAVVTSAYYNDYKHTGSYSTNHPDYRDHAESYIVFYENLLKMFDELHASAPDLFIDCTFETAGKVQLMDYSITQHAEGNWLSNFEGEAPHASLRVRQMAWWRTPAMPASSLVIGNMAMDDPNFELTLKSLIGTLPIALGDPRKLSDAQKTNMKKWSKWMQEMQDKYDYMAFRKDLKGFGEPKEGFWDGWQRLNFNTRKGGIFGVFRQGGSESRRLVVLDDLIEDAKYEVKLAPTKKVIYSATGKSLMNKGFEVKIDKQYDGKIFEVSIK